jgi:hypothetical protein
MLYKALIAQDPKFEVENWNSFFNEKKEQPITKKEYKSGIVNSFAASSNIDDFNTWARDKTSRIYSVADDEILPNLVKIEDI